MHNFTGWLGYYDNNFCDKKHIKTKNIFIVVTPCLRCNFDIVEETQKELCTQYSVINNSELISYNFFAIEFIIMGYIWVNKPPRKKKKNRPTIDDLIIKFDLFTWQNVRVIITLTNSKIQYSNCNPALRFSFFIWFVS